MASLRRDDATNALPVLTRRRGVFFFSFLFFFFSFTFCRFVHGATERSKEERERKRKKRRTAHALHRLRFCRVRSGDSITRLNLKMNGANLSGRDAFTEGKTGF